MNKVIIVNNPTIKPHEELEGLFVIEYQASYMGRSIDSGMMTDDLDCWAKDAFFQAQVYVKNELGVGKILPCSFEGKSHEDSIVEIERVVRNLQQ